MRVETNLSLSNLTGAGSADVWVPLALVCDAALVGEDLGAPKNEVKEASFFGFFRSVAERASAFRLVDIGIELGRDMLAGKTQELEKALGSSRQDGKSCERLAASIQREPVN